MAVALHTPPVRTRLFEWLAATVRARYGIALEAADFHYNLATRTVRLGDVRLRAAPSGGTPSDAPFLQADRIEATLSWALLRGELALDVLRLTRPEVTLLRHASGDWNLPRGPTTRTGGGIGPASAPVRRLRVESGALHIEDVPTGVRATISQIDAILESSGAVLSGTVVARKTSRVEIGGHLVALSRIEGHLALEPTAVAFRVVRIEAPEGEGEVAGRLSGLSARPRLDLQYRLALRPGWAAERHPRLGRLAGALQVAGEVRGPLATPLLGARLTGSLAGGSVRATLRLTAGGTGGSAGALTATYSDLALPNLLESLALPLRLDGRLDGRADVTWSALGLGALEGRLDTTLRAVSVARSDRSKATLPPVGEGRGTITFQRGRLRLSYVLRLGRAMRLAGDVRGHIDPNRPRASPFEGTLVFATPDLVAAQRLLDAAGVATGPQRRAGLAGDLRVDAALGGPWTDLRVKARVSSRALRTFTSGPGRLEARLRLERPLVHLDSLEFIEGANRLSGQGRLQLQDRTVTGTVTVVAPDLPIWLSALPPAWRPAGAMVATATLTGSTDAPRATFALVGDALTVSGRKFDRLEARGRVSDGTVFIDEAVLRPPPQGRLVVTGSYRLADGRYRLAADLADVTLESLAPRSDWPLRGQVSGRIDGEGTSRHPKGTARLTFRDLAWRALHAGEVRADVQLDDPVVRVTGGADRLGARLQATASLRAQRRFTVLATLDDSDLTRWVAGGAGRQLLSGRVTARLEASGSLIEPAGLDAELALDRLELRAGDGHLALAGPARLRYAGGQLAATDLELRAGRLRVSGSGLVSAERSEPALLIDVAGPLADLVPLARTFTDRLVRLDGQLVGTVSLRGPARRPVVQGHLAVDDGVVAVQGWPDLTDLRLRAALVDGVLAVDQARARWEDTSLTASLRFPLALLGSRLPALFRPALPATPAPARLTASLAPITAATLRRWLPAPLATGLDLEAIATAALEADALAVDRLRGELTLETFRLALAGWPLAQRRPTRVVLADGRLRVADWEWADPAGRLGVTGDVDLAAGGRLALRAEGSLDLRALAAVLPGAAAAGRGVLDVRVGGAWSAPLVTGAVEVLGGELRMPEPRLIASDLHGTVSLQPDRLLVENIEGLLNGGSVRVTGELTRKAGALAGGALTLEADGVAVAFPRGLRAEAAAEVRLVPLRDGATLQGRVAIRRGAYREPLVLSQHLLAARRLAGPPGGTGPSWRTRLALDLAIVTEEDVLVDNNYGRFPLAANVRLLGRVADPGLLGRITLGEGGRIVLGGRGYRIERGTLEFVDPRRVVPEVDLTVKTRVSPYEITLALRGAPDRLTSELSADDATLSELDLVSLLVTGRRASEGGLADVEAIRRTMLSYLSGDLLGLLGQPLGLDSVRLERGPGDELFGADPALVAAETNPETRLSLTKRLSPQVELLLSQNLREPGRITWVGTYRPTETIELRAVARDDNSRAVAVSQRRHLGDVARRRRDVRARVVPRVTAVVIQGTPGVAERELLAQLQLRAGERFDFFRWQEDRERLEQWYRTRGFLEARVTTQREPLAEDAVRLVYRVDRGPRTTWSFEGYAPSTTLRAELTGLWAASVFDGFLVADVETRLRRELAGQGYLRAAVRVTVETARGEDPPRKTLRVQVERGPRTVDRRLEFRGNTHLPSSALDQLVRTEDLERRAWLTPVALEEALRERYRREGFLAARVKVGSPIVDGPRAVLPVEIVEGPRFRIGSVRVEGARARRTDELLRLLGAEPGAVYQPDIIDRGQRAIELAYRRDGYNGVSVRMAEETDESRATVALTLQIDEGPRQVLDTIVIEGAPARRSLIERALALEPGSPMDLEEWYQARKRLYQTGLFSRVDVQFEPLPPETAHPEIERVRARVTVAEHPPFRIRYGAQLGERVALEDQGRVPTWGAVADVERRNLLGGPGTAGVTGRYEPERWLARGFFRASRSPSLPLTSSVFITRSHERVSPERALAFVTNRTTLTAQQEAPLGPWGRVTYGYSFARDRTFAPEASPDDPLAQGIVVKVARVTGALTLDRRDDPFDPTRGWFHASAVEYADAAFGSDLRFVKYVSQTTGFVPSGRVVLAGNLRLGLARGLGQELIVSERFRGGGSTSVRGYGNDTLGPIDVFGEPAGGNGLLVLNGEVRVPLGRSIRGVSFIDAGNVVARASELRFDDLKVGVGFGLRVETPVGLVRVDVGRPVPRRAGEPGLRWYFSLGHAF